MSHVSWATKSHRNLEIGEINEAEILQYAVTSDVLQKACDISWFAIKVSFW